MKKYFSGGYYRVFFIRILFIFLLFTFTRALFYFLNYPFFRDIDFITVIKIFFFGLRFDLAAIIITYSPFIIFSILPFHFKSAKFYQVILLIFFSLSTAITQAANLLDCAYFHHTLSRTTSNIFNTIGLGTDFTTLLPQYVKDFWYLFLIWICIIIMSILFFIKTKITKPLVLNKSFIFYVKDFFVFVLISIFSFIGARGGVQLRPINIITAGKYASSKNTAIVLNTPFTIIKTIGKSEIKYNPYYKEEELTNIYSPVKYYYNKAKEFNSKNVVLIILESFSREYIGALNKNMENGYYKGYTPFLDSLIDKSLVFPNTYANTKRSVEAIPAILVGIPALMNDSYISSKYSGNTINSLAGL
ncbi:MAG TPA: sulfatase-like hydrolase/transferase, partial [Bacteroidales bacterium]|nr:sulfatase-like hydrolase/transferase [Bacteroidales bacterium]